MRLIGLQIAVPEWLGWLATPLGTLVANLVGWTIIALIVFLVVLEIARRLANRSRIRMDEQVISILRRPLLVLLLGHGLVAAINTAYGEWPVAGTLSRVYNGMAIVIVAVVAWQIFREVVISSLRTMVLESTTQADDIIVPILSRIGPVIIVIAVANAVVATLGGSLSTLLASLGLLGLVLGYLLQEPLQGLFSGTYMALDDPFHEEDLLILEDGTTCQVRNVGVRVTQLYDVKRHVLLFFPNSKLAGTKIINLIKPNVELRSTLPIIVDKSVGCRQAMALLIEACNGHENILGSWSQKGPAIHRRITAYQQQLDDLEKVPERTLSQETQLFALKDTIARLQGELIRLQVDQSLREYSEAFNRSLLDAIQEAMALEKANRVASEWPTVRQHLAQLMDQFDTLIEQITVWLYLVRAIEAELVDESYEASIAHFVNSDLLLDGHLTMEELAASGAPERPTRPIVARDDVKRGRGNDLAGEQGVDHRQFIDHDAYADYKRMYVIWHRNIFFVYRGIYRLYSTEHADDQRAVRLAERLRDLERYFAESFLLRVSHWQLPTPKVLEITDSKLRFELSFFVDDVVREHYQRSERVLTELQMEVQRVLEACDA